MVEIRPFKAFRPSSENAKKISSPPYDIITRTEAKNLINNNSLSFLKITRSDAEFDDNIDSYDEKVYLKAKENLNKFLEDKLFLEDQNPGFYIYSQTLNNHTQIGLTCLTSTEDYLKNLIKKHEKTREDKENDRTKSIETLNAHLEPVFLTYEGEDVLNPIINNIINNTTPSYNFTSEDNVTQKLWPVFDKNLILEIKNIFKEVECLYIADGHHRVASASNFATKQKNNTSNYTGDEEYNFFPSVIFHQKELKILSYNRVVKDLNGLNTNEFLDRISQNFEIINLENGYKNPPNKYHYNMYIDGKWIQLKALPKIINENDVVEQIDASIIQNFIFNKILNIINPRTDKRLNFIGGEKSIKEIESLVDSNKMKAGFVLYPTSIDSLIKVAKENKLMPPKSTWFDPKLRSGLFIHVL